MQNKSNCPANLKAKYIIITYLSANKNKKFTARQINQFILENHILGSNLTVSDKKIINMIKLDKRQRRGVLKNVQVDKQGRAMRFYVTG